MVFLLVCFPAMVLTLDQFAATNHTNMIGTVHTILNKEFISFDSLIDPLRGCECALEMITDSIL